MLASSKVLCTKIKKYKLKFKIVIYLAISKTLFQITLLRVIAK